MSDVSEQQSGLPVANKLLPAESWDYLPAKERFKENAISMGVMVGYGLTLSQIFNPAVFFAVSGISLIMPTVVTLMTSFPVDPSSIKTSKIPEEDKSRDYYAAVINEYAAVIGTPKQRFSFFTRKDLFEGISLWEKFKLKYRKGYAEERIKMMACVSPLDQAILMSREMTQHYSDSSLNFVFAHEVSHTKAKDGRSIPAFAAMVKTCITTLSKPLVLGTVAGGVIFPSFASVFAGGLNIFVGGALFAVSTIAATLGMNYVSRIAERRADRNAVFLTRDMQGPVDFLIDTNKPAMKVPKIYETKTHPSFGHRHQNIRDAFALANQYERVVLNLPTPPREILESKNNQSLKV